MKASLSAAVLLVAVAFPASSADLTKPEYRSDVFASTCRKAIDITKESLPADHDGLMVYAIQTTECYGYIKGFIDGHNMTADHAGNSKQFCIPKGVAYIQVARLVVKASDDRPEIGHYPRETIVEYVLKSTWPCDASGT